MTEAIKLYEVMRITLKSRYRYLWDMIGSTLFLGVVMFIFVRLWTVTYQGSAGADSRVAGFTLAQMIWYLVASETIIMSMIPIHRHIEREIKDGDVAIRLNKPLSFLGYHWATFFGEGLLKALVLIAVGGAVAFTMVGPVDFSVVSLPLLFITFILTATANFYFGCLIGLMAFWTEDVTGIFFIFDRLKWLLGGFLMPITVFPDWLQKIVAWLPFPLMIYRPAELAVGFEYGKWAELTVRQVLLVLGLGLIAQMVYRSGVRRLSLNGG